ncbi:UDP-N-acetylmuramoyl-tripeptide--D-alanyl-D-alanine ligase, partial [Pseudorhodobacter sp.]|uniref:UDP-N-acetylmuramoyl-tripeptide--D-alanyl-D- alanine ligase n=1 Tax=Pseudorhodobacter sp. TaxID=1934400 RepID=UPI002648912C
NDDLRAAIERSLTQISTNFVKYTIGTADSSAYLIDAGNEVKLGGNAVAILALCKFSEVTGDDSTLTLARQLGNGILSMQNEDGSFCHILDADSLAPKQAFRTVYYDGEAAFGLMRLYGTTGEKRWLDAARRAVDYFISKDYWKHNDHWLAYCVNELSLHYPEKRYLQFGLRNVQDYLNFIRDRITTFPTLLELCCATRLLVQRSHQDPSLVPTIDTLDLTAFQEAMETRAQNLANGFFFPEVAMYFRNPVRITGSFFIRHHGFRVRIDDVEHYLSGLIAYRSYLEERNQFSEICERQRRRRSGDVKSMRWTSTEVANLLKGSKWLRQPSLPVRVSGLSTYAPGFRPGDIAVVRQPGAKFGIAPSELEEFETPARIAIVDSEDSSSIKADAVLYVPNLQTAIVTLAKDARRSLAATVIGVTGSAGKTSVTSMIAHCLDGIGKVSSTRFSANMLRGIAWNICCAPVDTEYCVLEMAIGQMDQNTQLARPDIVVFTNIHPAHLIHHKNTATIAARKSQIFAGMPDNGVAILNRDMDEYEIVVAAAAEKGVTTVTYGWTDLSDIHPTSSTASTGSVELDVFGQPHVVPVVGAGSSAVYNTMAIVATLHVLHQPVQPIAGRLATFTRPTGRGQIIQLATSNGTARILDHSYNANPASTRAALEEFFAMPCNGNRVIILGQMAELGDESRSAHIDLIEYLATQPMDSVHLIGDDFRAAVREVRNDDRFHIIDLCDLDYILNQQVAGGDLILIKGSNSAGLFDYLGKFRY